MTPELHTDRLLLRQWRFADFAAVEPFLADPEMARYRTGDPLDRFASWGWFTSAAGQWAVRGYGIFAAEIAATGAFAGFSGIYHPITLAEPELSYSLLPAYHGKGYAVEMANAVKQWAANDLGLPALHSLVHPDNLPSRRVSERLGAAIEGEMIFCGHPRLIYRHTLPCKTLQQQSIVPNLPNSNATQSTPNT